MAAAASSRNRLGDAMNGRRLDLNLRWETVAQSAGISVTALRMLRTAVVTPRELTQRGLEKALAWEPGSIKAILDGGDPVPIAGSPGGAALADDRPALVRSAWADENVRKIWALDLVDRDTRTALVELYLRRHAERAG